MAPLDALKRAPKWAWFTAAGVTVGAVAIRVYNGRDAEQNVENVPEGGAVGSPGWQAPGGGASGVIVPPVIIPDQSDPLLGVADLMGAYLDAITGIGDAWEDVYGPIAGLVPSLIPTPDDYIGLIQAGAGIAQQTPVVSVVPVPQPAPAPAPLPAPAPQPAAATLLRTCGTSFNGQDGNCRYKKVQHWSDGRKVEVSNERLHKGRCGKTDTDCW